MSYKMYSQNFQQAFYGMNSYNAYFWNQTAIYETVLVNFTSNTT